MSASFLVVFNSQGANVVSNATRTNITYNVNWAAFLPTKYKKFHCQFIFKSQNYTGANGVVLSDNGFVNMSIGKVNVYDGIGMTSNIGIVYPVVSTYLTTAPCNSFYNSTNNDNNDFFINYPTNQSVNITLNTFAGVAMANMPHYCLYLSLVGLTDEELDIRN